MIPLPTTPPLIAPHAIRMSYTIGRGETGVLSFEPYKSFLLPLWRFRTPSIARSSTAALTQRFHEYLSAGDFVGMDMTRKFLQMGMTRSMRYANHKGGRKYRVVKGEDGDEGEEEKVELERSEGHEGQDEKKESAAVFREAWERVKAEERYKSSKEEWLAEKKDWIKNGGEVQGVKKEEPSAMEGNSQRGKAAKEKSGVKKEEAIKDEDDED